MHIAAFFDIDHTLIAADSAMLFMRYLLQPGANRRPIWSGRSTTRSCTG